MPEITEAEEIKVTVPSGAWVQLHVPARLKAKHQKAVFSALDPAHKDREVASMLDLIDGVLAMLITDWSVVGDDGEILPIPSADLDSLGELEIADSEFLQALPCVGSTAATVIKARRDAVASPDDWDDPSSPTAPSSAPGPRSRVEAKASAGRKATRGKTSSNTSGSPTGSAGPRSK